MPIFRSTEARITEPAVGASTWAAGSQVWNGNIGTLMAKARKKARKTSTWKVSEYSCHIMAGMKKLPVFRYRAMSATRSRTEPARV